MTTVTLLTSNAAHDDLTVDDYRQIYDELRDRGRRSLREFVELIGSTLSIAWWSKYESEQLRLTRTAKNELRVAVGLARLPHIPGELLADPAVVSPDARVYAVQTLERSNVQTFKPSNRVILIDIDLSPVDIHVNSDVTLLDPPLQTLVTTVTRPTRRSTRKTVHLSPNTWDRLNTARTEAGYTWEQFAAQLMALYEAPL